MATIADRKNVYLWLAESDLTSLMLGPPLYPDNDVPTWYEFVSDYEPWFFDGSRPAQGQCYIIEKDGEPIGQVAHGEIMDGTTELDIWMRSSSYTGKGYGSDALDAVCRHLARVQNLSRFYIAPSKRNVQAVKAYKKAGFIETKERPYWFMPDYKDTVLMRRDG